METIIKNDLKIILIKDIIISKTNPRQSFDEKALEELSKSIQDKGVFQPILVRPKGKKYELVCGERRLRASKMAKKETIPANIRELTDDEAFELQIIENLERKDVHPLDESKAFQRMLDSGKYTIEDIAVKMARTANFIAQRLKLNDLIDSIKADFFNGLLPIGQAVELSKVSAESQKEIRENSLHWHTKEPDYGTLNKVKQKIENQSPNLKKAPFDIKDEFLLEGIPDCLNCLKCSAGNPVLFNNENEALTCFDKTCYNAKVNASLMAEIDKIIETGKSTLILSSRSKPEEEIIQKCKDHKAKILIEWDDFSTYERTGHIKQKGLYVTGADIGKYKFVYVKSKATSKGSNGKEQEIKSQINKVVANSERALELDREKIMKRIHQELLGSDESKVLNGNVLQELEHRMLIYAIYEASDYELKNWIKEKLVISENDWKNFPLTTKILEKGVEPALYKEIIRRFILSKAIQKQSLDVDKHGSALVCSRLAKLYYPEEVEGFIVQQNAIAEKRQERIKKKIRDLKQQLNDLKPKKNAKKVSARSKAK